MHNHLKINNDGLIFSSTVTSVSGTVNMELQNKSKSYEIQIVDKTSNVILQKSLKLNESNNLLETTFTWDLKSKFDYVESGCYTIYLIDKSNDLKCCSAECKVVDTRNILSITKSLENIQLDIPKEHQMLISIYSEIIQDIQSEILERLKNNQFEESFFVACITAYFIQLISDDLQNQSKSQFSALIAEFQSKNPLTEKQMKISKLGLWGVFDFLINYMSDLEDQVRAKAMAICGQSYLSKNDKAQIISSLVIAIYPHCKTEFPKNLIGNFLAKLLERTIKLGIKYVSTKHVNKSISISQSLPMGNPCEVVIR